MNPQQPDAHRAASDARPPTMTDVAKHAGVSRPLVSMVLRGVDGPSERSKKAILASAAELGFRVNTSAQRLRQSRTRLIGVLFATHHPFEAEFVERLLERAPGRGFGVVLAPITASRGTDVVVSELMGHRVEALACFNPEPDSTELQRVLDQLPVVWLGERSPEPRADAVRADDDRGIRLAVDHLVALGHHDICYVGGLGGEVGPDRAEAYRTAMRQVGLEDRIDVAIADFTPESAVRVARELIARPQLPTAIIAGSDQGAAAMITVLARSGVSVPGEVSIIGYDDSDVAALSSNALTSIKQDIEATVDATLTIIERRIADPSTPARDHPTPATLVVRGSTGPVRSAHRTD